MSENEKKAIEIIKQEIDKNKVTDTPKEVYITDIKMLLNLVKIQQKEIEIWKETENDYEHELARKDEKIDVLQHRIEELLDNKKEIMYIKPIDIKAQYYISEDKIEEKIKELEDNMILFTNDKEKFNKYKYARSILEKILEEK